LPIAIELEAATLFGPTVPEEFAGAECPPILSAVPVMVWPAEVPAVAASAKSIFSLKYFMVLWQ